MRQGADAATSPGLPRWAVRRVRRDPIGFLQSLAAAGDLVPFSLGSRTAFLLNHPAHIEHVLVSASQRYAKGHALGRARRLLGDGLLTAEGDLHRQRRRVMTPAFHRESLARHAAVVSGHADALAARWVSGQVVDLGEELQRLTLGIVGQALFGIDLVETQMAEIRAGLVAAIASLDPLVSLLAPVRRMRPARERLLTVVDQIVDARVKSGAERDDLLGLLLASSAGGDPAQLRDDVLTMLLAGHDTIANALTWAFALLARHADAEQALHLEVARVAGAGELAAVDLDRLPFTRAVFAEALRVCPPAWVLARRALVDDAIAGTHIPAGALVVASQYLVHRDPRFFEAPLVFDPWRWSRDRDTSRPKLSYFPFGAGPRSCIGESFGWMEGVLVLAAISRRWRLASEGPDPLEFDPRITLQPRRPVMMRVGRA